MDSLADSPAAFHTVGYSVTKSWSPGLFSGDAIRDFSIQLALVADLFAPVAPTNSAEPASHGV